jgi:ornithine cyclodeaminase
VPLALVDGNELTARRTAAASALAASRLARTDARRHLVVGAGAVAALLPHALRCVRPIEHGDVWARRPEAAAALAERLRAEGLPAHAAPELAAAVAAADVVSCATLAAEPLIHGGWLAPGVHLDLVGSFTPAMREADDACFAGAEVWIDTDDALAKSGDLAAPLASGALARAQVRGTLHELCAAPAPARDPQARTIFKSVGTALEDLAAAMLVYEAA